MLTEAEAIVLRSLGAAFRKAALGAVCDLPSEPTLKDISETFERLNDAFRTYSKGRSAVTGQF